MIVLPRVVVYKSPKRQALNSHSARPAHLVSSGNAYIQHDMSMRCRFYINLLYDSTLYSNFMLVYSNNNKTSAVAEMGDRGHNIHGPKGGLLCPFRGAAGSPSNNVAWAEVYFRTKWNLHPSNLGHNRHWPKTGGRAPFTGELSPQLTQCRWASVPSAIFDPSSSLAIIDVGRKLRAPSPFGEGAGSPSNTMSLGLRPASLQVTS